MVVTQNLIKIVLCKFRNVQEDFKTENSLASSIFLSVELALRI